jgi:signal transduction histidine kinase
LETVAQVRGIEIVVAALAPEAIPSEAVLVPIAPEDCALFLSNLLLNAIQHSPSGSLVEARLVRKTESVTLEIEDHGEGIDPAALPHVFDRFYRGDPSRTRSTGGTGLGLSIVKAVVEMAGGSIAIASQPGHGTTVTVQLPFIQ